MTGTKHKQGVIQNIFWWCFHIYILKYMYDKDSFEIFKDYD